jgi:hypothetical protein
LKSTKIRLRGGSGTSATSQTLAKVKVARATRWSRIAMGRVNQPRRDFLRSARPINECSNIAVHLQNQVLIVPPAGRPEVGVQERS